MKVKHLFWKIKFTLKMYFFKQKPTKDETFKKLQEIIAGVNNEYSPNWGDNSMYFTSKEMAEYACKNSKFINIYKDLLL